MVGPASHVTPGEYQNQRSKKRVARMSDTYAQAFTIIRTVTGQAQSNERIHCALTHRAIHRPLVINPADTVTLQSVD